MSGFEPFYTATDRGLVAGLRDHGYIEGKNLIIERRYGHLDPKRYSVAAHELAGMNLDAIVTVCSGTTRAVKDATNSTPIVMLSVPDPVGQGLAASLAHPGTNVTGRSSQHFDLVPKMLQLFHEAVPKAGRIAVLVAAPNRLHQEAWAEALVAARSLNVDLIRIEMQEAAGLDAALDSVAKSNANALFVLPDSPPTFNLRRRIIAFARERALPLLAPYGEFVEDGALISYGESYEDAARGVAGRQSNRIDVHFFRLGEQTPANAQGAVPALSRVAILYNPEDHNKALEYRQAQEAARILNLTLRAFEARSAGEIDKAFAGMADDQALLIFADALMVFHEKKLADLTLQNRLPAIFGFREFTDLGGLISYGANLRDQYRRAASYVDKILKGANPGDLPIEQPTRFELIINLKTAKALGLEVPLQLQQLADEVIE